MKLKGDWNGKRVLILIDLSSIHSFVSSRLASELHVAVNKQDGLRAIVAIGETICSPGMYRRVPFKFGLYHFPTDLFILLLSGFNIVLVWISLKPWDRFFRISPICVWIFLNKDNRSTCRAFSLLQLPNCKHSMPLQIAICNWKNYWPTIPLFVESIALPPNRSCDHRIILEARTRPGIVWPYHYPHDWETVCRDVKARHYSNQ